MLFKPLRMPKLLQLKSTNAANFPQMTFLFKRNWFALCCTFILLISSALHVFAEGSKEIAAHGGYRAYLFSSTFGDSSFPFPTMGTMKVYAKAGETIYVGSSAQGFDAGTINFRAPDGTTYTSGTSTTVGLIANHSQELAGPLPNAGGYTPYKIKVAAAQEGVWEIDFVSESNGGSFGNPDPIPANAEWVQPVGLFIVAFDVSVRDVNDTQFLKGRVFTNVFSGQLGAFNIGFNGIFNILTSDGYQYVLNNNGQAGNGFTFLVNNKGFRNPNGSAAYMSIDTVNNPNVQDPRLPDSPTDITQKIFFNPPSADLPASAKTPGGTTWLLTAPAKPTISNVTFTGVEGTVGRAGTSPLGGNFDFTASTAGTYSITIDVNNNGVFTDPIDRTLTGQVITGPNHVFWDGLDGQGHKVPPIASATYQTSITLTNQAGEVHFPFFDVERNVNGLLLTRINGDFAPDDTVYWNDTQIPIIGTPSNPIKNLTGISSTVNGHKWGKTTNDPADQNDFGNNKGIETWSYISFAPIKSSVTFALQEADLAVDSVTSIAGCAGQPVMYAVTVQNNGPDDVTGAKFFFNFPPDISGVTVSSVSTSGTSSETGGTVTGNVYRSVIAMANGAVRTFTINGNVAVTATALHVAASIMRPPDVTDPDATNPDAAPPTDPVDECNSLPSGTGCNNIVTNITAVKPAPNAGPDQSIIQYSTTLLKGSGSGLWTQATGDPAVVAITNPTTDSTSVANFVDPGVYHFIYTNENGCADSVAITVTAAGIVIPNIFTPNNDGKNDVFNIKGLESFPGSQLIIFNRWGNEVYHADNYLNNWNGSGLAEGTYYYILNRKEPLGSTVTTFKGWVFLKRIK